MTAAFEPVELIAAALSAMLLAVTIALPVAAGALAAPRRMVNAPGLGIGVGLLIGTLLAGASIVMGPGALLPGAGALLLAVGLLCAMAASVLILLRREPTLIEAVLGTVGCVLIGLGEPSQTVPTRFAISSAALGVVTARVVVAVAIVAIAAVLALLGGRLPALRFGVAAGALVAGVLALWGLFAPAAPLEAILIVMGVALVAGTIVGAVLGRRRPPQDESPTGRSTEHVAPPA